MSDTEVIAKSHDHNFGCMWSKWTWRKASSASDIISTYVQTIVKFSKCVEPSSVTDSEKWEAFIITQVRFQYELDL